MAGRVVRFKDMLAAKGTELYDAIVEKKDTKLAEKLYKELNKGFLDTYPQCTKEWFDKMNGKI